MCEICLMAVFGRYHQLHWRREFVPEAPHIPFDGGFLQGDVAFVTSPDRWDAIKNRADDRGVVCYAFENGLREFLPSGTEVSVERTGKWEGWGHGYKQVVARAPDGALIYKMKEVAYCDGPGSECTYSHGPWYEYGGGASEWWWDQPEEEAP